MVFTSKFVGHAFQKRMELNDLLLLQIREFPGVQSEEENGAEYDLRQKGGSTSTTGRLH